MRISITSFDGNLTTLEIDKEMQALIEAEMSIPSINQALIYNGKELSDDSITIQDCGIVNDDMIFVNLSASELARQQILNNPQLRSQFHQNNPELERALNDPELFKRVYTEMQKHAREVQNRNNLNFSDPFDVEAQKQIEAEIRKENIARNYENAIEHNPEFFGRVIMLYIKVEVNGIPVKAFVDSGAQVTIMSPECAEKCRLMQILDHRFSGVATGVGTAKIIGRIHSTIFKIGKQFLPVSLSVMEGKDVDLLLGLDVLKRHQACIDLKNNCLVINDEKIPFLSENELPEKAKEKLLPSGSSSNGPQTKNEKLQPSSSKYSESIIDKLVALGAKRDHAIQLLDACGGDADLAANMLFGE